MEQLGESSNGSIRKLGAVPLRLLNRTSYSSRGSPMSASKVIETANEEYRRRTDSILKDDYTADEESEV